MDTFDQLNPTFEQDWSEYVATPAQYFLGKYADVSSWNVGGFTAGMAGLNLPTVDPAIAEDTFYAEDPIDSLNVLVHEPQHNLNRRGLGHRGDWDARLGRGLRDARGIAQHTSWPEDCCELRPNKGEMIGNAWQGILCGCQVNY
jgi:hypothetical protein